MNIIRQLWRRYLQLDEQEQITEDEALRYILGDEYVDRLNEQFPEPTDPDP